MAITSLSICNSALTKIGVPLISALTDNNKQARLCNEQYPKVRDEVFRATNWAFATKRVQLTPLATPPAWGYANAFQLPSDYLKIQRLDDEYIHYKIENGLLLSDESVINLKYTYQNLNTSLYTSDFAEALALRLAADLAYSMNQAVTLQQEMMQAYQGSLRNARLTDSQEGTPEDPNADPWGRSRY